MLRFHLDEMVPSAVAAGLRRRGMDVTTTVEAGLRKSPDLDQLEYATREGRVLVTHDPDLLRLHAEGREHAGIAFCHQTARTIGEMITSLALMDECLNPEEMHNRVEFI
jgi:predicted nuclease of predicted toxin-antitoxin system